MPGENFHWSFLLEQPSTYQNDPVKQTMRDKVRTFSLLQNFAAVLYKKYNIGIENQIQNFALVAYQPVAIAVQAYFASRPVFKVIYKWI